ncbi:MAG: hypothetical protein FWF15_02775 [Oscillospiraceae bacterium]|nr:hypothetical protein [Oscillospiraceae bacterium]
MKTIIVSHGGTLFVLHQIWLGAEIHECKFNRSGTVAFLNIDENGEKVLQFTN